MKLEDQSCACGYKNSNKKSFSNHIRQVVSLELAKKLKELGVRQEGICNWLVVDGEKYDLWDSFIPSGTLKEFWKVGRKTEVISAFTVAELGEMLKQKSMTRYFTMQNGDNWCAWEKLSEGYWHHLEDTTGSETEADARAKMLIHLIENKIITV